MRVLWMFPATVLFIGVAALWWKVTVVISVLYFLVWLARAPIGSRRPRWSPAQTSSTTGC